MQSQSQLRSAIYTALKNDSTITNNIFWLSRPTILTAFPCVIYSAIDTFGGYAFCGKQSETVQFQIDLYVSPEDVSAMDTQFDKIKTVMEGIGYRNMGSPAEFLDADINKIVRVSRWEIINV